MVMQRQSAVERNKKPVGTLEVPDDFRKYYLDKRDRQMRFNNGRDPIYHIFASIDRRPLGEIFNGFVKDTCNDVKRFIKKLAA